MNFKVRCAFIVSRGGLGYPRSNMERCELHVLAVRVRTFEFACPSLLALYVPQD